MKSIYVILSLLIITITGSFANNMELFPEINGWKISDKIDVYTTENLWNKINGAADGYYSYEFKKLLVADYTRENEDYISVEIYEHSTPVMAFGIYSSERPSDGRYNETGTQGYELDGLFNFLADRYYVKIYTHLRDNASTKAIREIAEGISKKINGIQQLPSVIKCFPSENLVPNSTIFISKNFMGYGFLNSAFVSSYLSNDLDYTLFIIEAKDVDAARNMILSYFKLQKTSVNDLTMGQIIVADQFNGDIPLMWEGNLIWGIQNGSALKEPFELLNKVKLNLKNLNLIQ